MRIEFVNHASFIANSGPVRLLCDPWFEGRIFNDGWDLLAPTSLLPEKLENVTHLWFSHEHPDHFHPTTLKAIPEAQRARMRVLYQKTADRKVVGFCRGLGFADVVELEPGRWHELAPGIAVTCRGMLPADSWLCMRTPEGSFLNVNDCELHDAEACDAVAREVGEIDLLFTQFSSSAWGGGEHETERWRAGLDRLLARMALQCRSLRPRYVVPFASFIWFCHEENHWMNAVTNPIEDVCRHVADQPGCAPVVMRPGDVWEMGAEHDPAPGIEFWSSARASIGERELARGETVPFDELQALSLDYCRRVRESSGALRLRLRDARKAFQRAHWRDGSLLRPLLRLGTLQVDSARIWLGDLSRAGLFDFTHGLRPVDLGREECEVELSSDSLRYSFQFLWGGDTLQINGRFREVVPDGRVPLFQDFWMAKSLNAGDALDWRDSARRFVERRAGRR